MPGPMPQRAQRASHSAKAVIASLFFLLTGFLPRAVPAEVVDKTAIKVHRTTEGRAAAVVGAKKVKAANSEAKGTPAAPPSASATYFDTKKVAAGFAHGNPSVLFQGAGFAKAKGGASNFEVHTSRIEGAGVPEAHTLDTDIYYVVQGSITMVTGGTIVNPKTVAPNQIRGTDIDGGETRQLSKGEVMVIPNGVPHWHKEVPGTFEYLVVKIR